MVSTLNPRQLDVAALLETWPMLIPGDDTDKEQRGHVLIVAGSREIPGAAILASEAALRAGAGKLTVATGGSVAQGIALAVPEARVIGLPESGDGLDLAGVATLAALAECADAILIGPGLADETATGAFVCELMQHCQGRSVILDATAMNAVTRQSLGVPLLLTPHAGEMAHLLGESKESIVADPLSAAQRAATRWQATVALKGSSTFIATPAGEVWRFDSANVGLATSGSGDSLAGLIVGFAGREADLLRACAWGVVMHGLAGQALIKKRGLLGYLARELSGEVPALLEQLRVQA